MIETKHKRRFNICPLTPFRFVTADINGGSNIYVWDN